MDPVVVGYLGIGILLIMILFGVHVFVAMGLTGFVGFWLITGNLEGSFAHVTTTAYAITSTYEFSVIPFFIILGFVVYESGMALSIFDAMYRWIGRLPAGLAIATTLAVAIFSAVSGSALASAVTFSKLAIPEMVKKGYNRGLACGLVAAAATQDALIPPSGLLVIYAVLTEQSIGKCLMAGLIPGFFSLFMYVLMFLFIEKIRPNLMPRATTTFTLKEKLEILKGAWQIPLLAVLVLGAIYTGVCTPTEASALGAFMAMILGVFIVGFKKLSLRQGLKSSIISTTMIYAIIVGAFIFGGFLAVSRIPIQISSLIGAYGINKEMVLLIIIVIYTMLGMFMSSGPMIVITMPIFFPIIKSLGYDPIWFGVIVVKMAGIGMLTPPVGLSVYAVKGSVGDLTTLGDIFKWAVIFLIMDYVTLLFLIFFPSISLFLPSMMR